LPPEQIQDSSEPLRAILDGQTNATAGTLPSFLVDVGEAIRKWRSRPASERVQSRIVANVRIDELGPDLQAVERIQQVIAIGSSGDSKRFRERTIQYSPESQQLSVTEARVYHAAGSIDEAEDLGEKPVADAGMATYYDLREQAYRFPALKPGDIITLDYVISPANAGNPYGQYFAELVAFGNELPCDLQRYVLRAPANTPLYSSEHLLEPAIIRKDKVTDTRIWEKRDIPGLIVEPRAPSWSEQGAYVHISNFGNWEELGRWYSELTRSQFSLSPELERVAAEIRADHPQPIDQVAALYKFVLETTRYVAREFGMYGLKPHPATETFENKFGDCKDKATLLVAMLRAMGIKGELALIRTQALGDIASYPASASIFDHAIVYLPDFDLWLDATADFSHLHELPVEDQGVMALTVNAAGNSALRRTPTTLPVDNYSRRTIDAYVQVNGTIRFSGATYVRGEDAPSLRREIEQGDSHIGYVRDWLAQALPAVKVDRVESPRSADDAVSLHFDGELSSFHGLRTATLPSSWMSRDYVDTLAPTPSRRQDVVLDAPWTTEEVIRLHLPPGATVASLPRDITISSSFGSGAVNYRASENEVVVSSNVQFSATRISAADYRSFRDFTLQLERAFRRNVELTLP
jgi:transglutaminase-like putative cysteine protease